MAAQFLDGVRVIDLTQYLPGPYAALTLANLGADVLKVEPPDGDPTRRRVGPADADRISVQYKVVNRGKSVVPIDLKSEKGKRDFAALVGAGDVLLESYRPGVLARLGFDSARLGELNPRLVHCALSGYGQNGPWRLKGGHDTNYMAVGGALVSSGTGAAPVMSHPPVADHAGAMQAVISICAALFGRVSTGKGAYIDCSMAEAVLSWQSGNLTRAVRPGAESVRGEDRLNGGAAYYNIYPTKDGRFVTLGAIEPKFWERFSTVAGHPEWIERQLEPFPQTDLIAAVASVLAERGLAEWEEAFADVDCCFQPVLEFSEVLDNPQLTARGMMIRHDGSEPYVEVPYPAWIDGSPPESLPPYRDIGIDAALAAWGANAPGANS